MKVHIWPSFGDEDSGDGGVRRVVEAQIKHLPNYDVEVVSNAEEADLIAAHITIPPPFVKLYPNKPLIALIHGFYWSEYEWPNWCYKANTDVMELIRISDAVVAPSEWVANSIRRHTSRPVIVINHGVDPEDWEPDDYLGYVLWNKTRPDPVCDPEPLNEVARLLPDVTFVSTFGEKAPNVEITGRLPFNVAKTLIKRAGIYLCTPRETFGVGTLEAMLCGMPIVGFNWGGQAEFIENGKDGMLVTPGDTKALAEAIKWAYENRESVGAAAREKALSFSWDKAAKQYADLFHNVYKEKTLKTVKTSIIVTNYNLHDYLSDCLESIRNQIDEDWECIIVDDASTDSKGRDIAKIFANNDSRFKLVENKQNVYLAESRNIGIRHSSGKYILPLDADDMLTPNAVRLLSTHLDSDKTTHIAYGNVLFVEDNGKEPIVYSPRLDPGHSGWPMEFSFENQIVQRNLLPYCSMYRKEAWQYVGGYRRRQRTAEDAELWTRLSSYGFRPKFVTKEDTLIYRVRGDSMSHLQSGTDWLRWFSWAKDPKLCPAGAITKNQLGIHSLEPIMISVVVPVGPGHELYVQDAIDSVEAQTFQNWECIVVNDTGYELSELPSWVRIIKTDGKTGPAHARNVGIAAAKGKLFLPLDSDDYLEPAALKLMLEAYMETKFMVYSDFWDMQEPGKSTIHECDDYDPYLLTGGKRTVNGQIREGMVHSVTVLTPKLYWEEVGGYDESLPAWEDWDFALATADKGHCSIRVAAPLFTYRKHTGLRREENYEFFDESKNGILKKWGKLWEGGKELMACGACQAKRTSYPSSMPLSNGASAQKISSQEGATMVVYTGKKQGATPYKGHSGTVYWFGANDPRKYVLNNDLDIFTRYAEFEIVQRSPEVNMDEPQLVAEGPPR